MGCWKTGMAYRVQCNECCLFRSLIWYTWWWNGSYISTPRKWNCSKLCCMWQKQHYLLDTQWLCYYWLPKNVQITWKLFHNSTGKTIVFLRIHYLLWMANTHTQLSLVEAWTLNLLFILCEFDLKPEKCWHDSMVIDYSVRFWFESYWHDWTILLTVFKRWMVLINWKGGLFLKVSQAEWFSKGFESWMISITVYKGWMVQYDFSEQIRNVVKVHCYLFKFTFCQTFKVYPLLKTNEGIS